MKTKYISILLFILAFAVVAFLGASQVWAVIDVTNRICDPDEKSATPAPYCFDADVNSDGTLDYVVHIYVSDDYPAPDMNGSTATTTDDDWPINHGTSLEWRYRATIHADIENKFDCVGGTGWNYFLLSVSDFSFIIDSDPPGARIAVDRDLAKCGGNLALAVDHVAAKWNPELNCGFAKDNTPNSVVFSIFTSPGVPIDACGNAFIVTNQACTGDSIAAPGTSTTVRDATFENCAGYEIFADFNSCTGALDSVICNEVPLDRDENVNLCFDYDPLNPGEDPECYQNLNIGPRTGGAAICTAAGAVFVYGEYMWRCPRP